MGYEGSFIPIKFIRLDYLVFAIDNHAMELDRLRDINEKKIIRLNTHTVGSYYDPAVMSNKPIMPGLIMTRR